MPALDGIRGIAILLVMTIHYFNDPQPGLDNLVHKVTDGGWMGVDLFFVLSGFLITGILLDANGGAHYFISFYGRRALRIFPLYYLYLVLLWAVFGIATTWPYWTYLLNIQIAINGQWPAIPYVAHLWSLAIEEQFYLLWPLVVLLCSRRTLMRLCLAIVALSPMLRAWVLHAGVASRAVSVLTPTRVEGLLAGALLAVLVRTSLSSVPRLIAPTVWAWGASARRGGSGGEGLQPVPVGNAGVRVLGDRVPERGRRRAQRAAA